MKRGYKPTRAQRKLIESRGLDAERLLVVKDMAESMLLIYKDNNDDVVRIVKREDEK